MCRGAAHRAHSGWRSAGAGSRCSPSLSGWANSAVDIAGVDIFIFEAWRSPDLDRLVNEALLETSKFGLTDSTLRWTLDGNGLTLMFAGDQPEKPVFGEVELPKLEGAFQVF